MPPLTAKLPRWERSTLGFDVLPKFVGRMRGWVWGGYYLDIGTHEALERARREVASTFPDQALTSRGSHRPAIFLDRDGTLIEHVHYLCDPALVQLLPGAAEALRRFRRAGFARVLVTNQSAIGRGMLTEERLDQIHTEMNRQLAACGATIDAVYHCPDVPGGDDRTVVENPDRKPGPGMLLRAAADLKLDLGASWMVGDLISDVLAGQNAGCRSILLESGQTAPEEAQTLAGRFLTAPDLAAAADLILANDGERLMKILLTGGAGYVGSACLRWLLKHGHDPIAYDNLSEGNTAAVPDSHCRLIVGDIADTDHLAEVLRQRRVEAVMHFAALASVPDSIADPEAYYRVNVGGTKSVLDAMRIRWCA